MTQDAILVVDDEPINPSVLTQMPQPHYLVRASRYGEHAPGAALRQPKPDLILLKPGKLTPEEFDVMKTHSRLGGEVIAHAMAGHSAEERESHSESLVVLETAQSTTTSHYERRDGNGYPEGLSGAAIPLPARMMAIADVYDALRTARTRSPGRRTKRPLASGNSPVSSPALSSPMPSRRQGANSRTPHSGSRTRSRLRMRQSQLPERLT